MRARAALAMLTALLHASAAAAEPGFPPLAGLKPAASAAVHLEGPLLVPDKASAAALEKAARAMRRPRCYGLAQGKTKREAQALAAALGEWGVPPERIIPYAAGDLGSAVQIYCEPPARIAVIFAAGKAELSEEARAALTLAALLIKDRTDSAIYTVVGMAGAKEADDAVNLALMRAVTARAYLVALGTPAPRLQLKSILGDGAAAYIPLTPHSRAP